MLNVMDVAEALIHHIRRNFPEDIAIVAYYGSYAQGAATARSDLDFFFIPATPAGYQASIQFILRDIGFDFWPISWDRAERMAAYQEPNTSIIADSKLLYCRSDEDLIRFNDLKDKIRTMPRHGLKLAEQGETYIRDALIHWYNLNQSCASEGLDSIRTESHGILTNAIYALAAINRTYLEKGWGKNTNQIREFQIKPPHFDEDMKTIMRSDSYEKIYGACDRLLKGMMQILNQEKESYTDGPSYPERVKGIYEEFKGIFDKLKTACERNDYDTAFFWSIGVQDEISRFLFYAEKGRWPGISDAARHYQELYNSIGLPNLAALLDPHDLTPLLAAVERLETAFAACLTNEGVVINRFDTLKEFEEFLGGATDDSVDETAGG